MQEFLAWAQQHQSFVIAVLAVTFLGLVALLLAVKS